MRPSLLAFLLCLLAFAAGAFANGAYFPPIIVSDPPTIPMQTALICHEEGVETLIVESNANAPEGDSFAWILPLPAAPTSMEPAGPSTLTTLRALVGRRIVVDAGVWIMALLVYLGLVSVVLSVRPWLYRNSKRPPFTLVELIIIFVVLAVLAAIAVPNFLGTRESIRSGEGIDVLQREAVGSYDVTVLKATGAEELEAWLATNGYAALGAGRQAAAQAYAKEGWVFLAMKIRRDSGVPLEPHPLKVVFPAEKAIFPMRLTAAPGEKTDVAIFLVGQVPYAHPLFETEFRKRVSKTDETWDADRQVKTPTLRLPGFKGVLIANQDVAGLVRHNEWITRLQATLSEDQMREDIVPMALPHDFSEARKKVFARGLVVAFTWQTAIGMCLIVAPIASTLAAKRKLRAPAVVAMAAAVVGMTAWVWFGHPKVDDFRDYPSMRTVKTQTVSDLYGYLQEQPKPLPTDREGRRALIAKLIAQSGADRQRFGTIGFEPGKGPMQYYFATTEDGADVVRFVLVNGAVMERVLEDIFDYANTEPPKGSRPGP